MSARNLRHDAWPSLDIDTSAATAADADQQRLSRPALDQQPGLGADAALTRVREVERLTEMLTWHS